jgi:hypothetical protein
MGEQHRCAGIVCASDSGVPVLRALGGLGLDLINGIGCPLFVVRAFSLLSKRNCSKQPVS